MDLFVVRTERTGMEIFHNPTHQTLMKAVVVESIEQVFFEAII